MAPAPGRGHHSTILFVGKGDDISLSKAKGAVVLVCDPIREDMINKIKAAGALGFVTICGTPLDQGKTGFQPSTAARQVIFQAHLSIIWIAVEIVEKQASKCCLNIQQSEISRNSANVAVRILGTDFPEEIVTVTAHYDSVPEGPGAYDNIVRRSMVMEAFHHFAEHRPARTMEFIWFGSEEKGLVGSQNYVKSHEGEMSSHVFNLNVDLAGQLLRKRSGSNCRSDCLCRTENPHGRNQLGVTIKTRSGPAIPILSHGKVCQRLP